MRVSVSIFLFIGVIALLGVQVESTLLVGKLILIKGKILITLLKIKKILKKLVPKEEEEEEVYYQPAPTYGPPPPVYGPPPSAYGAPAETSSYSGRKRRSVNTLPESVSSIVIPDEESIDQLLNKIYRRDSSRCIEKLVCNVASKAPVNVTPEEAALLELAQSEPEHGFAFRRMEAAMKAGFGGSDCKILFDSCPFSTSQMMKFIKGSKTVVRDDDSE